MFSRFMSATLQKSLLTWLKWFQKEYTWKVCLQLVYQIAYYLIERHTKVKVILQTYTHAFCVSLDTVLWKFILHHFDYVYLYLNPWPPTNYALDSGVKHLQVPVPEHQFSIHGVKCDLEQVKHLSSAGKGFDLLSNPKLILWIHVCCVKLNGKY